MLLSSLASATPTPLSSHNGTCLYGGDSTTTVRIRFPPGSGNQDFAWPPLPPAGDAAYDFALDRAVIALAPGCVASEGLVPNAANGPSVAKTLWIGRLTELARPPRLDRCGCGAAILLCGSGGLTGDNLRYVRHLAAEGFSVVAPDTMAAPTGSSYPRTRPAIVDVSAQLAARKTSSYWCANDVYSGGCAGSYEGGAYPACFSSNAANIAYDPAGWVAFYERVFEMRRREADSVVSRFAATFGRPARFFVAGNSEGAMVASRYTHPALAQLGLAGRVLSAWSCEYNYFVSCAEHVRIPTDPAVPVLNLLSANDPFFAAAGSVAADVAQPGAGGYGAWPLSGSCAAQLRAQALRGASFRTTQPYHDQMELSGSFWRYAVGRFLHAPDAAFSGYRSVLSLGGAALDSSLCTHEAASGGVLSADCDDLASFIEPKPSATYNVTACDWPSEDVRPWFVGFEMAPATCAMAQPPSPPPAESHTDIAGPVIGASVAAFFCGVATACIVARLAARRFPGETAAMITTRLREHLQIS